MKQGRLPMLSKKRRTLLDSPQRGLILFVSWIFFFILSPQMKAQSVVVEAKIDSIQLLIGEQTKIRLQATYDSHKRALFPVYTDTLIHGIELLEVSKLDTQYVNDKNRMTVSVEYTITSFDSALYYLPPMEILIDSQTYKSNSLALKVLTVPVDTTQVDTYFDIKPIFYPAFFWKDYLNVMLISLLLVICIGVAIYLYHRLTHEKPIIKRAPKEPKIPPHVQAMNEIDAMKQEKLWQNGDQKHFYTHLTAVLRNYMEARYNFDALEMTSNEIVSELLKHLNKEELKDLRQLLQTSDLVKFAKYDALLDENQMNIIHALRFVDQTKEEIDPNAATEPDEVSVEIKRSRKAKTILISVIVGLTAIAMGCLGWIIYQLTQLS